MLIVRRPTESKYRTAHSSRVQFSRPRVPASSILPFFFLLFFSAAFLHRACPYSSAPRPSTRRLPSPNAAGLQAVLFPVPCASLIAVGGGHGHGDECGAGPARERDEAASRSAGWSSSPVVGAATSTGPRAPSRQRRRRTPTPTCWPPTEPSPPWPAAPVPTARLWEHHSCFLLCCSRFFFNVEIVDSRR